MAVFREEKITSAEGYVLTARVYEARDPRAVIRIIHGMEEYQDRYEPFAAWMQERGYTVLTADLRGHGPNAPILSHIADADGDRLLIEDERVLLRKAVSLAPGKPVYLLGHSMGSIIARKLLQTNSGDFSAVVLSGYPNPRKAAAAGVRIASLIRKIKGAKSHSGLLDGMVLGGFSRAVRNEKSPLAWLSYNEENWQRYKEDPLCGAPFTVGSYHALFCLLRDIGQPALYQNVRRELPMLLISGADDPCTGGEKGRTDSLNALKNAGFESLRTETLSGMRHEVLNEEAREKVYGMILSFFESVRR